MNDAEKKKLRNKTYVTVVAILLVFGVSSVLGSLFGTWLDSKYEIEPTGKIIGLVVSYVISWAIAGSIAYKFFKKN